MRHLIDPMDLSLEEIDQLLQVGDDIIKTRRNILKFVKAKSLQPSSMNQAPVPDSALNLP